MSLLRLYFDLTSKRLVNSLNNSGEYRLPDIHQEDKWSIEFSACQRINYATPPFFSLFGLGTFALTISVGTVGVANASQNVWTANADNTVLSGVLNLNTAGISALADGATQIFEVKLVSATESYICQQEVTYHKIVAPTGTLATPASDRALGAAEAAEIYVSYEMPAGRGITFVSEDGTKKQVLYLDNDGTPRWVNLT